MKYGNDVKYICEIQGKAEIEEKFGELKIIDVVLADERKLHILERRGKQDYELIMNNLVNTLQLFDELYIDYPKSKFVVCYVKKIQNNKNCVVFVRLSFSYNNFANSIIIAIMMSEKKLKKLARKRNKIA